MKDIRLHSLGPIISFGTFIGLTMNEISQIPSGSKNHATRECNAFKIVSISNFLDFPGVGGIKFPFFSKFIIV